MSSVKMRRVLEALLELVVPVDVIARQSTRSASDGVGRGGALCTLISAMDGIMNAVHRTAARSLIDAKRNRRREKEQGT
jgi:hypothetical protein